MFFLGVSYIYSKLMKIEGRSTQTILISLRRNFFYFTYDGNYALHTDTFVT